MSPMPVRPLTDLPAIAEHAPVALVELDPDRAVADANPAAEVLFGLSRRSLVGRAIGEILAGPAELSALIDYAFETAADIAAPQVSIKPAGLAAPAQMTVRIRRHGDDRLVLAFTAPLSRNVEDGVPGVASFGRILGHEIKNPLAGISGAAQLLLRKGRNEDRELLQLVCEESARIERLVNRLSAFELFSAPRKAPMNIHRVLDRVIASEEAAFDGKIAFARRYDPSLPDIDGDSDHLHEAFQNIVRNGCEAALANAGKRTPRIELRTAFETRFGRRGSPRSARLQRALRVDVLDSGAGVDKADLPRLFEAFSSSKSGGRGLGLTVVKEVVTAHSGQIDIESDEAGTRVSVFLPLSRGEA